MQRQFRICCWLLVMPVFFSAISAFSARTFADQWRRIIERGDDVQTAPLRLSHVPTDAVEDIDGPNRAPVIILAKDGRYTPYTSDEDPRAEDAVAENYEAEAKYLLNEDRNLKKNLYRRKTHFIETDEDKPTMNLLGYLSNKKRNAYSPHSNLFELYRMIKSKDHWDDDEDKYDDEDDTDYENLRKELEKDYVHVARSTGGFIRQMRRPASSSTGSLRAVVDILAVVDNALYRRHLLHHENRVNDAVQAIKKYYAIVISLVDFRYSQIDDEELNIRVRLSGVYIAQDRVDSPWSEGHIRSVKHNLVLDPNVGLEKFQEWIKEEHKKLPKFDHAMGFTGYTLANSLGKQTSGMAYIGTVCKTSEGYACSIIQEDGGLASVSTAVHELGHSLGAKHDGEDPNTACTTEENYIMAPVNSAKKEYRKNFFRFSRCSLREFKSLLSTEDAECLFDTTAEAITVLPGQVISPNEQCKDVFGTESGVCQIDEQQEIEEICTRIWCIKPGRDDSCLTRGHLTPVLGTPCGVGKMCQNGHCLDKKQVLDNVKEAGNRASGTGNNRIPVPAKPNRPNDKPVKIEHDRPRCKEDTHPEYCRTSVYQRPDICQRKDMAAYCCFSCSFV